MSQGWLSGRSGEDPSCRIRLLAAPDTPWLVATLPTPLPSPAWPSLCLWHLFSLTSPCLSRDDRASRSLTQSPLQRPLSGRGHCPELWRMMWADLYRGRRPTRGAGLRGTWLLGSRSPEGERKWLRGRGERPAPRVAWWRLSPWRRSPGSLPWALSGGGIHRSLGVPNRRGLEATRWPWASSPSGCLPSVAALPRGLLSWGASRCHAGGSEPRRF